MQHEDKKGPQFVIKRSNSCGLSNINTSGNIFTYTKYDKSDEEYINILKNKANIISNSKNCFNNKIKNITPSKKDTNKKGTNKNGSNKKTEETDTYQKLDYTTLHLLSIELNALLKYSIVEHITQVDDKTIVLHLNQKEQTYYLYICYDNDNPVITLGLKIKKLFNRFIEDDYAQKLNPVLKYGVISDIYIKKTFIKILCIDFILKKKTDEDIDIYDVLSHTNNVSKKVTLLFDLHHNSCISFVINKMNNEIIVSPHNLITEKTIDKSYKEGHIYIYPNTTNKNECRRIPNHYEFFSSFLNLFKSRKEQNFISSLLDIYEGISYNMLIIFFNYLNINPNSKFEEIKQTDLIDFFNNAYIKWIRFLNLKERDDKIFTFFPHFSHTLKVYSTLKFIKGERRHGSADITFLGSGTKCTERGNSTEKGNNTERGNNSTNGGNSSTNGSNDSTCVENRENDITYPSPTQTKTTKEDANETHFETVIELVYYYYSKFLSVNQFYSILNYCKDYVKKKRPLYEDMLLQYQNDKDNLSEKVYLLQENIQRLDTFSDTLLKMNEWIDKKQFDALKLIQHELQFNPLEDNRKKYVKKCDEKKQKEETFQKKIINVHPNTIKTAENIYKGSLLIKINETDILSPFLIIGRNSKQNENISTRILKPNDLWFHVHEHPGGHVILRHKKINNNIITSDMNIADINVDDDIKYAANMAAYFSKARKFDKVPVCFTFGKYVLKDKTLSEGAVEVLKYKLVYG
ncbi:FbpA domain protein, putative, partial [Hepatocystis sp. ex Piliocolobus tephrosceles]